MYLPHISMYNPRGFGPIAAIFGVKSNGFPLSTNYSRAAISSRLSENGIFDANCDILSQDCVDYVLDYSASIVRKESGGGM